MKKGLLYMLLILVVLLTACRADPIPPIDSQEFDSTQPPDVEPTVHYGWASGESSVPEERIGLVRAGFTFVNSAVSPTGIYFVGAEGYILYADNGSDILVKLCGRPDCTHLTTDCNAYVYKASEVSYYNGHLYAVSGEGGESQSCSLIRMDPDGTNRVTVLDLTRFAQENGGVFAECDRITNGFCLFSIYGWVEKPGDQIGSTNLTSKHMGYYYYKLDGSMKEPEYAHLGGMACFSCGSDVFLTYFPEAQNGGALGSYWNFNPDTNEATFLTDHPGRPGWFGAEQGFYYKDGAIRRLTYNTQIEEVMVDTGLEGEYYGFFLPDCIVITSYHNANKDNNLYIYNWAFQLIETVPVPYTPSVYPLSSYLIAETADKLILADESGSVPKYYINKSELGSGNVKVHAFVYA